MPPEEKASALVSLKVKPGMAAALDRLARERGISRSAFIITLISAAAQGREPIWARRAQRRVQQRGLAFVDPNAPIDAERACKKIGLSLRDFAEQYDAMSLDEVGEEREDSERRARLCAESADLVEALRGKLVSIFERNLASFLEEEIIEPLEEIVTALDDNPDES